MPHRNIKALDVNALTAGEHDRAVHSAPQLIAAPVQHQLRLHLQLTLLEPVCSNQLLLAHRLVRLACATVKTAIKAFRLAQHMHVRPIVHNTYQYSRYSNGIYVKMGYTPCCQWHL